MVTYTDPFLFYEVRINGRAYARFVAKSHAEEWIKAHGEAEGRKYEIVTVHRRSL